MAKEKKVKKFKLDLKLPKDLQAAVELWQTRYHELALKVVSGLGPPPDVSRETLPGGHYSALPTLLSPLILDAIDQRSLPFSPERAAALTYARDALAAEGKVEEIVAAILAGETIVV